MMELVTEALTFLMNILSNHLILDNFVRNPQFQFSLTDPDPYDDQTRCPLVISLAQRVTERKTEHAVGFRVYEVGFVTRITRLYLQHAFVS